MVSVAHKSPAHGTNIIGGVWVDVIARFPTGRLGGDTAALAGQRSFSPAPTKRLLGDELQGVPRTPVGAGVAPASAARK